MRNVGLAISVLLIRQAHENLLGGRIDDRRVGKDGTALALNPDSHLFGFQVAVTGGGWAVLRLVANMRL